MEGAEKEKILIGITVYSFSRSSQPLLQSDCSCLLDTQGNRNIFRALKQDKIKRVGRGVYVGA